MVANIAAGEKPGDAVPDADEAEMRLFLEARKHLPPTVIDAAKWQAAVGDAAWKKVVYVLNRGGRFQDYGKAYDGEKFAKAKSPMTGKKLSGVPVYQPVMDVMGCEVKDEADGYNLHLITYREVTQTTSRTVSNYWLGEIQPSNQILMNGQDATRLGIKGGQQVRVVSKTNPQGVWDLKNGTLKPMVGEVKVIEGIRPGVVAFSLGKGHWAYGARTSGSTASSSRVTRVARRVSTPTPRCASTTI